MKVIYPIHLTEPQGKIKSEKRYHLSAHQKTGTATDYCVDLLRLPYRLLARRGGY